MKSIEMSFSLKGLAGITVDSTKAKSDSTKAFVRIVREGKVFSTSSLSRPLQTSPTEKNNAKIKRHVALWEEQSLVFPVARDAVIELQIWLRLPSGKDMQIGAGSMNVPAKGGATDVKVREIRRNYGSPYRLDASGDAKLRMYVTWQEKEAGNESASKITAQSSSVALHHSGFEISAKGTLEKSSNRELNVGALNEPELSLTRPDPPSIEADSLEPSVEQVFVPKSLDHVKDVHDMPEQKSKNPKKKSPFAKLMGWGRSKQAYDSLPPVQSRHMIKEPTPTKAASPVPVKKVKDAIPKKSASVGNVTTPKKTVSEVKSPKEKELNTPKRTVSRIEMEDERLITPKKSPSVAQLQNKAALTPQQTTPPVQVQKELFTTPRKVEAVDRLQREEDATPKRTGGVAHAKKDFETTPPKMESIAQTKKELFPHPEKTEKVGTKSNSPRMDPPDSSSALSTSTFKPAKKEAVVGPERSSSSMTTKMANSMPPAAVRLSEPIQSPSEESPQLFMFSTPKADFRLRSKSNENDGFEQMDFSFPTPDFSRHTTPRMGSKQMIAQPTVEDTPANVLDDQKPLVIQQNDKAVSVSLEPDLPAERPRNDKDSSHARNQQPSPAPARDMDDYSLFSEDDSTFLAKPKQIFGLIRCCIMGDEDSIYGFDETLTFDETLGEDTVNSYDDTITSELPMDDWWCQSGFGGRSQTPSVLRRRQIWKERMQQLAEQNGDVKELFESESEAGSTRAGDDEDTATHNKEQEERGLKAMIAKEKPENCTIDPANSEALGLIEPPSMSAKINP